jgi:hypothetical protein
MDSKVYYLYRHIRLDKNIPFYIGVSNIYKDYEYVSEKSKYKRAYDIIRRSNLWKKIASKTNFKVEIIFKTTDINLIEQKEKEFIKLYGRIDNKTGSLANHNNGGAGLRSKKHSDDTKNKIRNSLLGRISSMLNKKHTDETKKLMSIKQKGRLLSDKHKKILSDKMKGTSNPRSKFMESDILNIRNLYDNRKTNKLNQIKIAKMYNTDQGTISAIVNKKKWNYV